MSAHFDRSHHRRTAGHRSIARAAAGVVIENLEQRQLLSASLVSVDTGGTASGNLASNAPAVSADGRFVAFVSSATNLTGLADTNGGSDVFLRDTQTGTTTLISKNSAGTGAGNGISNGVSMSSDSHYICFISTATDLVAGQTDTNGGADVMVYDTNTQTMSYASENSGGTGAANGASTFGIINYNGTYVAFTSAATDLVAGITDTNSATDVFRRDTQGGTVLVSADTTGTATGNGASSAPSISGNGSRIAYQTLATDVTAIADTNAASDIIVYDVPSTTAELASLSSAGADTGDGASTGAKISRDGSAVAFVSAATDLVAGLTDANSANDVFVHLVGGASAGVSVTAAGTTTGSGASSAPVISGDGAFVAFVSASTDLVSGLNDNNTATDVFVRDMSGLKTSLVSANSSGTLGNGASTAPSISDDGLHISFVSAAKNLVSSKTDTNVATDVFSHDVLNHVTKLISLSSANTTAANGISNGPVISSDGSVIVFVSTASNIVSGDANGAADVFTDVFPPTVTPSAPSNLIATTVDTSHILLTWQDNSNNEQGFSVERSLNGSTGWTKITTVGKNVRTYTAAGLNAYTRYYFRVRATSDDGYSPYAPKAHAVTFKGVTIRGKIFSDFDRDGFQDPGEKDLRSWRVFIDTNKNGRYDLGEVTTHTDLHGIYKLTGVNTGKVRLAEVVQPNFQATKPGAFVDLKVTSGQNLIKKDFGNKDISLTRNITVIARVYPAFVPGAVLTIPIIESFRADGTISGGSTLILEAHTALVPVTGLPPVTTSSGGGVSTIDYNGIPLVRTGDSLDSGPVTGDIAGQTFTVRFLGIVTRDSNGTEHVDGIYYSVDAQGMQIGRGTGVDIVEGEFHEIGSGF